MLFRQLFDPQSSTYTYLIADLGTRTAILVDSVLEQMERDYQLLKELELMLRYCLETHIHTDHITSAGRLWRPQSTPLVSGSRTGKVSTDAETNLKPVQRVHLQSYSEAGLLVCG